MHILDAQARTGLAQIGAIELEKTHTMSHGMRTQNSSSMRSFDSFSMRHPLGSTPERLTHGPYYGNCYRECPRQALMALKLWFYDFWKFNPVPAP